MDYRYQSKYRRMYKPDYVASARRATIDDRLKKNKRRVLSKEEFVALVIRENSELVTTCYS